MSMIMRIFGFVAMAALGFFSIFAVISVALEFNIIAALPPDARLHAFRVVYFGGGLMSCIVASGIGVMSFFTIGTARRVFMLLPLLVPVIYSIAVLTYFSVS